MSAEEFAGRTFSAVPERCGRMTDVVMKHVACDAPLRVLDIGCGTGAQLNHLAARLPNAQLHGVDISQENIRVAREIAEEQGSNDRIQFSAGDYMTYAIEPVDVIVSDSTLQNIPGPSSELFGKIAHDLKDGGLLINSMPYACMFNHLLWGGRRIARSVRCRPFDGMVLAAARLLHRGTYDDALLEERVHYMYLIPHCYDSESFRQFLSDDFGLACEAEYAVTHASIAQPKHRMTVSRKRT